MMPACSQHATKEINVMTTRDTFLDMLAPAPVRSAPPARSTNKKPGPGWIAKPIAVPPDPFTPKAPKINARPDFADDIDRIVGEMVASGDVYLDVEADTYRTRKRSWKYGAVS
jgi:hypothetical protein